jgi:hypothetical protein
MDDFGQDYIASKDSVSSVFEEYQAQVLLIDLENCPTQIDLLLQDLEKFSFVALCYAHTKTRVPVEWLLTLTEMINSKKLKIIQMPTSGKNAADFGLCFVAGTLMQKLPANTLFVIMSDDSDLDHTVGLLRSHGRTAVRISLKIENCDNATIYELDDFFVGFCQKYFIVQRLRVSSLSTFANILKAHCAQMGGMADQVLKKLKDDAFIYIDENYTVTYNEEKITQWAKDNLRYYNGSYHYAPH